MIHKLVIGEILDIDTKTNESVSSKIINVFGLNMTTERCARKSAVQKILIGESPKIWNI